FSESEKKKRKILESSSFFEGEVKVDAFQFVRKYIYFHIRIGMDDVFVRNYFIILAEESIRAAGVCIKFFDMFEKIFFSFLGLISKVE
ncbi:hypothetical protein DF186_18155, partial [Enterococcus hirae]